MFPRAGMAGAKHGWQRARPLPLKGSVGVTRRIAWIVVATLGVAVAAHAQTAGTARVPQTVQERVDALARQLRDLERELALSDGYGRYG